MWPADGGQLWSSVDATLLSSKRGARSASTGSSGRERHLTSDFDMKRAMIYRDHFRQCQHAQCHLLLSFHHMHCAQDVAMFFDRDCLQPSIENSVKNFLALRVTES